MALADNLDKHDARAFEHLLVAEVRKKGMGEQVVANWRYRSHKAVLPPQVAHFVLSRKPWLAERIETNNTFNKNAKHA